MKGRENMKYKIVKSFKDGNLWYKIKSLILGKLLQMNHFQMVVIYRQMILNKYKRKYSKKIEYHKYELQTPVKKVWVCWFQGRDNAPLIVKKSIDSIYEKFTDWEIHFLTKENLYQYIDMPAYIIEKWEKGIITHTHFSDIVRINLLFIHGGLWVDATTYFTDKFPDYLINSDLFYYNHLDCNDYALVMDSWLIYAKPQNPILGQVQNLLFLYWKKKKHLCEYFLAHLFFEIVLEKYPEEWDKIPYKNSIDAHILIKYINKKYDESEFEFIKSQSFCHKLNYKCTLNEELANTYYKKLIKGIE